MRAHLYSIALIAVLSCAGAAGCEFFFNLHKYETEETSGQGGSTTQGGGGTTTTGAEGGGGTATSAGGDGGATSGGTTTTMTPNCMDEAQNGAETDQDCGGGDCPACGPGLMCIVAADCQSGVCVDGVCCNTDCNGTCQSCNLAGNIGTCTPIPAGEDRDNECGGMLALCDGQGMCKAANGQACSVGADCAFGQCIDGFCCDKPCDKLCESCDQAGYQGTCRPVPAGTDPIDECPVGAMDTCNGAGMCGVGPDGAVCLAGMGAACNSGYCVDGFCCNQQCTVKCTACTKTWTGITDGMCGAIVGQDPQSECGPGEVCIANDVCGPP